MDTTYKGTVLCAKRKIGYSAILLFEIDFECDYTEPLRYIEMTATDSPFYFWALTEERLQKKLKKKCDKLIEELKNKYGVENVFPYRGSRRFLHGRQT